MRAVRTLRDAEIIIGDLLTRIEKLESTVRTKTVQEVTNVMPQDSTVESIDVSLNADMNVVTHKLRHNFLLGILVDNVQVVGTQQSDPGAGPSAPAQSTLGIGGSAGGTYTGTEQSIINDLVTNNTNTNTNVYNLKVAVDALITCVNNIRTALRNYGLCA